MQIAYKLMVSELVKGCRKGDRLAQRKLYEFFYPKMMGVCLRYAQDRDEAAFILNNGFYKVFTHIDRYNEEAGELEAWIRRIVINTAIDHYRKWVRQNKTVELKNARDQSDNEVAVGSMEVEAIMKLVQQLPPAYRTVFNLYAVEGLSHKEIGEKLGISEGTSKSNLAKARKKLQAALAKQQEYKLTEYAR